MKIKSKMSDDSENKVAFDVVPPNPPNKGILFVDHSKHNRSGHLGHALAEYAPGQILAFYPNCSDANDGHNGDGWMEYKRSKDGGHSWSNPVTLSYSKRKYESGNGAAMCEKAVRAADGTLVLFTMECMLEVNKAWRPLRVPRVLRSTDGGRSWGKADPLCNQRGRVMQALVHEDTIFVLEFCNDCENSWYGSLPKHHYALYVSTDHGKSFECRAQLPFDTDRRDYGTMAFRADGSLIAYVYNHDDEKQLDYVISLDEGRTWSKPKTALFAKQIRNPQLAAFRNGYVLHGRSGSRGKREIAGHFVLYTSADGINWDEGRYLKMQSAGAGAYSNNVLVHDAKQKQSPRLLIQASHAYKESKTNIYHWWLE
jgi:hypothetical protein